MAVEILLGELRTSWIAQNNPNPEGFMRAIKQATKAANEQINAYATSHPEFRGMGTTATVVGLLGDTLYLAQVGDSRAYLVRNGVARQITKDQSLMQKLIEAGELTEEEAAQSERRNIILQALGPEPSVKVDLTHQTIRRGDTLVLCSDGLSGQVSKDEIAAIVRDEPDLTAACRRLIDQANAAGGPDNITVIVARFDGAGLRPPGENGDNQGDEIGHRVFPLPETGQTPAMSVDRVIDPDSPTQPIPVLARPRTTRPLAPELAADAPAFETASVARRTSGSNPGGGSSAASAALAPSATVMSSPPAAGPIVPPPPVTVSATRRSVGRLIAVALLALLVIGAAWFLVRSTRAVADSTSASPTPRSTRP